MPELPDLTLYREALAARIVGQPLERIRIQSPSLLKTVAPAPAELEGRRLEAVGRIGKRLVLSCEGELHLVLHLMIAGRLHWKSRIAAMPRKTTHAAFDFPAGSVHFTEAGTKKRASLHIVEGHEALRALDPGGLEVFAANAGEFRAALLRERHTLKRALTDPHLFAGIGNAYSDDILHAARLSPYKAAGKLTPDEVATLHGAIHDLLSDAIRRSEGLGAADLKAEKRLGMRVHGRAGEPCPVCGDLVREVSFADSSLQYCAVCQTEGKPLADRRFSKFLK